MKRLFLVGMVLACFFLVGEVFAFSPDDRASTSGEKTADASILAKTGYFHQVVIMPDGNNDVTVSIYDNASAASGTEILPTMTFDGTDGPKASPPVWVYVNNGIYVDVTVAGGGTVAYVILYRAQ